MVLIKGKEKEVIIDPEERDIIIAANKELDKLDSKKMEFIESTLDHKISNCDLYKPDSNFPTTLGTSLGIILSPESTTLLLNLIPNPNTLKLTISKMKEEKLISDKTSEFISQLTMKYGTDLNSILLNLERPYDWQRISSQTLVGNHPKIQSRIWRTDGEVFDFNVLLTDSVIITEHIIRKTLDAIELIDKEIILDFDEGKIEELEKRVSELKELRKSVEFEIEKIEETASKTD